MLHLDWTVPSGPIWVFFVVAVLICLAPWLAARLRLPDILVLLVAGFVIGPHALGIVTADDTIIPALGQLGLLYLMFIAGAELDLDIIQRHRRSVAGFSVLTFGVPMTLGVGAGVLFGYGTAASLLIGSLCASHTLLTYPTVRNAGLAAQPAVASTVGATVVTDTLALTVLAGVAGAAIGAQGGPDLAAKIVLGLIILGGWCIIVLPRLGRFFYARIGHQPTIRYTFVLSALLSAAVLAEVVGIEGIVGAFFAGLGLNHLLVVSSRDSASPALDFATRLAAADDGVVLPRVAALWPGALDEHHLADLERLIARRGLDAEAVVRHDRSLADLALHAAQDEHATAVVVAEPSGALRDARVADAFRDLGARCPVPLFVVAAPRPFRCVRCVGQSSADGLVEHLQRAGLEVAGSAHQTAALGRLLQRPQLPQAPDGALVIMRPDDPWHVPEDTLLVAVVTAPS